MMKERIFNWIINILLIILLFLGIYLFADRIFGNSPTDFQLISWVTGFLIIGFIKISSLIYSFNREIGGIKIGMKHSFNKIKIDIKGIKTDLNKLINIK